MKDIDYKIWCTYHKPEIPQEYNLYDSEHFKLFYNDDFTLKEDNINYLHDYLCELGTYYYVWKNNLKSDIVGFCQYRRHIYFDNNIINKFGLFTPYYNYVASSFYKYINHIDDYNSNDVDIVKSLNFDYFNKHLALYFKDKYNINIFDYFKTNKYIFISWHNTYFFKWNVFCDVCDFVFGFLDSIFINDKWKIKSNIDFLTRINLNNITNENIYGDLWTRALSVFFEWAIGLYLGIKYKLSEYKYNIYNSCTYIQYCISCKEFINDYNKLLIWIKLNAKSGIRDYIIKSNIDFTNEQLEKFNYTYNIHICHNEEEFINTKNLFNNFKNIELKLNERIHCDNSIEFYNGNYYIETY